MSTDRRTFLKLSAAASGALALSTPSSALSAASAATGRVSPRRDRAPAKPSAPLNILILGGTGFTGPEQVNYALERGHKVTLFNRNKTRPDMFKGKVDLLIGDLGADVSALKGKKFDVVLDNPTTLPFWVRNAAQHLKGNVGHYIFISTESVYPDNSVPGADETAGLTPMPPGVDPYTTVREHAGQYYGALKTFSEQEVARQYGSAVSIVRAGLIVGPLDRSDRFTYWPARIDRGGEVLAPGTPDDPSQFIDSRDLAEFMIRLAENKVFGTFNVVGPAKPTTMAEVLYGIKAVTTAGASFTWVPAEFLAANGVRGWRHMPIWLPPNGPTAGFLRRSNAKALAAGLTFRPLAVTAKDTLDWHKTRPEAEQKATLEGAVAGIPPTKEAEVLAAWKAKG
jgi:2'-hydroxyisoflavone reductase